MCSISQEDKLQSKFNLVLNYSTCTGIIFNCTVVCLWKFKLCWLCYKKLLMCLFLDFPCKKYGLSGYLAYPVGGPFYIVWISELIQYTLSVRALDKKIPGVIYLKFVLY